MKYLKIISVSLLLAIIILVAFVATQKHLFWIITDWLIEFRRNGKLEGDERGLETFSILFEIYIPVIYLLCLGLTHKMFSKKRHKSLKIKDLPPQ